MAEINNVTGKPLPVDQNVEKAANQKLPQNAATDKGTVGRGNMGQPIGLPTADPTTQNALMPNAVTGRDVSQLAAAEKMRSSGGHSATEVLLGLNQKPSMMGVLLAPPGNLETLRHLTPSMRRKILRDLLSKQRDQIGGFVEAMREEKGSQEDSDEEEKRDENESSKLISKDSVARAKYDQRALRDLEATTKMLDLLDEFLGMQDYTLSQMGTFAQG